MKLVVGPPGLAESALLLRARERLSPEKSLTWVTLPHQRRYFLRRLGERGAALGVEVLHFQQFYFKVLSELGKLRPVLGRGGRIARVADAYREVLGRMPGPGEAVLYTRAIAEAKRNGLLPEDLPVPDAEAEHLVAVFARYEAWKQEADVWDADDVRAEAVAAVTSGRYRHSGPVFVGGFWELGVLEARFLLALEAGGAEVWASLPEPVPYAQVAERVEPSARKRAFRAQNPVQEIRWALTRLKRDVASGIDPQDLALVVPPALKRQVALFSREYEIYLMDEAPLPLAETEAGQRLIHLLEFEAHMGPEVLLHFEELADLGREALRMGLVGRPAIEKLARAMGLEAALSALEARLRPPSPEPGQAVPSWEVLSAWAARLLEELPFDDDAWRERFLEVFRQAVEADPLDPRPWWATFLKTESLFAPQPAGIALLTPDLAIGRRYRKAYVIGAQEGVYRVGEREDYFFPEEWRRERVDPRGPAGLPRRLRGQDRWLWQALTHLAEEVWISYPETSGGEVLSPEPGLFASGEALAQAKVEALASPAILQPARPWTRVWGRLQPRTFRHADELRRFADGGYCGLRFWFDGYRPLRQSEEEAREWWSTFQALARATHPPEAALSAWGMAADQWRRIDFLKLVPTDFGANALVRGYERSGAGVVLHHFAPEDVEPSNLKAWGLVLAYDFLQRQGKSPRALLWAFGKPPVEIGDWLSDSVASVRRELSIARRRFRATQVVPRPGWHCRKCPYLDLCGEGVS